MVSFCPIIGTHRHPTGAAPDRCGHRWPPEVETYGLPRRSAQQPEATKLSCPNGGPHPPCQSRSSLDGSMTKIDPEQPGKSSAPASAPTEYASSEVAQPCS